VPLQVLRILLNFAAETYLTQSGRPLIEVDPVRQLSLGHIWNKVSVKQTVIPAAKMPHWYRAVMRT